MEQIKPIFEKYKSDLENLVNDEPNHLVFLVKEYTLKKDFMKSLYEVYETLSEEQRSQFNEYVITEIGFPIKMSDFALYLFERYKASNVFPKGGEVGGISIAESTFDEYPVLKRQIDNWVKLESELPKFKSNQIANSVQIDSDIFKKLSKLSQNGTE